MPQVRTRSASIASSPDACPTDVSSAPVGAPDEARRSAPDRSALLRRVAGISPAILISIAYVVFRPSSKDFSSGDFRARLFGEGAYVWNLRWFAGHSLPGYGLVSPALGAVLGVVPVAIISMLVAAWAFGAILSHQGDKPSTFHSPTIATMLFSVGCGLSLWGGRLTFGPAVAFGSLSVLCLQRRRTGWAVATAILCGLSSPVGALSLAIVATACWAARTFPRRSVAYVACAAVIPPAIIGMAFPEGGWYPFPGGSFIMLGICLGFVGWFGRRMPTVRLLVIVYAVVAVGAFIVRSPLGGNIVRLAWLAAAPAAVLTFTKFRRTLLPTFVAVMLIWGWSYVKLGLQPASASAQATYYEPLADFVTAQPGGVQRVEVVPTESLQQADQLALEINIARGWEVQLDRQLNPEFYDHLSATTFHSWLLRNSVSLVALPLAGVQLSSHNEEEVIDAAPDYLQLIWSTPQWKVFRVTDAKPLADNGATITDVGTETLTIDATRVGVTNVRFRYSKWFQITS
ncbi:MAG: hypothetical protein JWN62_3748, partial [Acidimicrobiales bacterium]|nr:hypothetical protein [Acidimicrobiales bacterium]